MWAAHPLRSMVAVTEEGWLGTILDSCRDGVAGFDREFRYVLWNPAMERISGLPASEVVGQDAFHLFPFLKASESENCFRKVLEGESPTTDGQRSWSRNSADSRRFDIHFFPVRSASGEVAGGLAVFLEVAAGEQAVSNHNRQQQLLQRVTGVAPLGFLLIDDRTDQVIFGNPKFCEIWGLEAMSEAICSGGATNSFLVPLCAPLVRDSEAFAQSCKPRQFPGNRTCVEDEVELRDGRVIKRFTVPVRDEDEVYTSRLVVFEDITDRRRIAEALRQKQAELRLIIDSLPILVAYIDRTEHYRYANKTYGEWFGEDPAGKHVLEVLSEDAYSLSRPYREAALRGEAAQFETYFQFRTGPKRYVHCSYIPDVRADGSVPGCIVFLYDLSDRKREEEALLEAEKLATMGRMAATIAHEINNPLASITNLVYLLESSPKGEQEQQWIALLSEEVGRVSQITRQTLGFYRQTSQPVRVDLSAMIEEVLVLLTPEISSRHAEISRNLAPNVMLDGYAIELRQMAINLITNALDAVGNGGTIGVETADRGDRAELAVFDRGPGIPQKVLARIFEPFFTTKGNKGTGLGLWVTRGIVEKHGGTVNVETNTSPEDSGTRFVITLPRRSRNE